MKKMIAALVLTLGLAIPFVSPAVFAEGTTPSVDNIVQVQPYSSLTYYGYGLTSLEITYEDGVDLSAITPESYILEDRGSLTPEFGPIEIESATVDGNVVTLVIARDTTATEENQLIYSGAGATGSRSKGNVNGLNITTSWYRTYAGEYINDDHSDLNGGLRGYQFRNLELKLRHSDEPEEKTICQADEKGFYLEGSKILHENIKYVTDTEKVDNDGKPYTKGGFMTLEDLGIQIPSSSGMEGDYVKGLVAFPEGYDPSKQYPMILSFPGGGTALWEVTNTEGDKTHTYLTNDAEVIADNAYGCCFFDGSAFNWYANGADAIVIYMDHRYRSPYVPDVVNYWDLSIEGYNYVKDDMAVIQYFIENYGAKENHIILTGNSQGTVAASNFIKAYPGFISTFICCNGNFGGAFNGGGFTEEELTAIAESGMSTWIFDGEYDTNNIPTYGDILEHFAAAGKSEELIADNIRITGIDAHYNFYWGETDHSATKFVYWYLLNQIFRGNGHIEAKEQVYDDPAAETYSLQGRQQEDGSFLKDGFEYKVYTDQTLFEWALNPAREIQHVQ